MGMCMLSIEVQGSEGSVKSSGTGVTYTCELPNMATPEL